MARHPHADLIKEWAEDTSRVVQFRINGEDVWEDCDNLPSWRLDFQYRFKPEPKPNVVRYAFVDRAGYKSGTSIDKDDLDNLKLTFSGEDGRLISAEVIS